MSKNKDLAKTAEKYLDVILSSDAVGLLSDTAQHWRYRNQIKLVLKTKNFLEEKGINPKKAKPEMVFTSFRSSSGRYR